MSGFSIRSTVSPSDLQKTSSKPRTAAAPGHPVGGRESRPANPAYTAYTRIDFADPKRGVIVGGSQPPRHGDGMHGTLPAWMEPERASSGTRFPTLTLLLQTTRRRRDLGHLRRLPCSAW